MQEFIAQLFFNNTFLGTIIASMLPVIEVKGAIPFALSKSLWNYPLDITSAILSSLIGSTIMVIILLTVTYPLCNILKKIKFVNKIVVKLEKKVLKIKNKSNQISITKGYKKYCFLAFFTAVPLPLTGYYTACLIASFCGFGKLKSLFAIIIGNCFCILIMSLVSTLAYKWVNLIFYFFLICFIFTLIYFVLESLIKKKLHMQLVTFD